MPIDRSRRTPPNILHRAEMAIGMRRKSKIGLSRVRTSTILQGTDQDHPLSTRTEPRQGRTVALQYKKPLGISHMVLNTGETTAVPRHWQTINQHRGGLRSVPNPQNHPYLGMNQFRSLNL